MANNNETTTKFKVDISELKKAMQDAKRQVAVANSEFKAVSSTMDDWSKSSDGLSAKLTQLKSNLNSQKSILSSLERQYELTVKEMGEGSKAADDLKIKINNQKAVINNTEREISNYNDALEEVTEAEKVAAKTGKSVAEVLDAVGDAAEDSGDGFTVLKGAVANFAGNVMTSFVSGIKDGISSLMNLASETREYREDLAKLETAYKTAGLSTEDATKVYKDFYAVLGEEDRSVEAVSHLAKFAKNQKDLSKWTTIATGVWGTFGDSLPIEGLTEAANETMKTGQLTGVLADALNWAGVNEDSFQASLDSCSSEQERQALITDTLNGLYSDAADNYRETNKSVMEANMANSDYTDTLAQMGEKIEPVTTSLKTGFNGLLQELLKLVGDVDMEAFTSKIEEGFGVLKDEVLPAVKEGLGWILDNKEVLIAGLASIAAGFVAFKVVSVIQGLVTAFQAWKLATDGMTLAQAALNLVMKASTIGLIVTAVGLLVSGLIYLWNTCEPFKQFWLDLWENIKNATAVAVESIGKFFTETIPNFFSGLIDWIKANWQSILLFLINPFAGLFKYFYDNNKKFKEFVDTAINFLKQLPAKAWTWLLNTINKVTTWRSNMIAKAKEAASGFLNNIISFVKQLPSNVWTWLVNVVTKIAAWRQSLSQKGREAAKGLFDSIINKIKELPEHLKSIGSDIVRGLWNGINDMTSWVIGKIQGFGNSVLGGIKDFFGINSPSKVMAEEVGKWLPAGLAVGINKNAKSALSAMKDLAVNTVSAASTGLRTVTATTGGFVGGAAGVVNNFTQNNYSPKALSRLEIYRQSKNLLGYAGGGR